MVIGQKVEHYVADNHNMSINTKVVINDQKMNSSIDIRFIECEILLTHNFI